MKVKKKIKVNKLKKYILFGYFSIFSSLSNAYVHNLTSKGLNVYWQGFNRKVDIFVNSENSQGSSESLIQSIANNSINEWNNFSSITLRKKATTSKNLENMNEIYFSNDPSIFNGSAVVGITQVAFNNETGAIVEADILLNYNFNFVLDDQFDKFYLGNVITHEVGHLLGLGHGQVLGSTMFYTLLRGQFKISDDDKSGIYSLYPKEDATKGSISGTIIGGKNLIAVYGAHVQALSIKTGKAIGATISGPDGKFNIQGLPQDDQYFIYTAPLKKIGLPINYSNIENDFCGLSTEYRGSFFQSCGSRSIGFPQAIKLNRSLIDIGYVSIRCALDSPPEYFQNKHFPSTTFDINAYTQSGIGGSFLGFFSAMEIQQLNIHDYFKLDLSNVNWDNVSTSPLLYLELKIVNQDLYSPFKANVNIKRGLGNYDDNAEKYIQNTDGFLDINTTKRIPINRVNLSDNEFEIKITPEVVDPLYIIPGTSYTKDDLFPSAFEFQDSFYFYLVTATIVKENGDGTYSQIASKNDILSDNSLCPDADNTYSLTKYTTSRSTIRSDKKIAVSCGSVDINNDDSGNGPASFILGFIFCLMLFYASSRYSKLA